MRKNKPGDFFEQKIPAGSFIIVKALNNAAWALQFYKKNNYAEATEMQCISINVKQKPWEMILCKSIL